jgi:hypothetical protein
MPKNIMLYVLCVITISVGVGVFLTDLIWGIADKLNVNAPILAFIIMLVISVILTSLRDRLFKQTEGQQ